MYITYHNSASKDTQNTCSKAKIPEIDCCLNVIMLFKLNHTFLPLANKEHTFASNSHSSVLNLFPILSLRRYIFLQRDMINIILLHWILTGKKKIKRARAFLGHIWHYMHDCRKPSSDEVLWLLRGQCTLRLHFQLSQLLCNTWHDRWLSVSLNIYWIFTFPY